jgi:protein-S-isoprenylcysteine O-methyltransferase Ste14
VLKPIKADNGMNIVGQGARIMLFTLPFVAAAVAFQFCLPPVARLPLSSSVPMPVGFLLIVPGIALWLSGVLRPIYGFPKGRLLTAGAYGVCRNPIYTSFVLFILPGLSLVTGTWVYIAAGAALMAGVVILIKPEEHDPLRIFGNEYRSYTSRVHRILPFIRPSSGL